MHFPLQSLNDAQISVPSIITLVLFQPVTLL